MELVGLHNQAVQMRADVRVDVAIGQRNSVQMEENTWESGNITLDLSPLVPPIDTDLHIPPLSPRNPPMSPRTPPLSPRFPSPPVRAWSQTPPPPPPQFFQFSMEPLHTPQAPATAQSLEQQSAAQALDPMAQAPALETGRPYVEMSAAAPPLSVTQGPRPELLGDPAP